MRDVWEMQRFDGTPFEARLSGRSVQLAGCEKGSLWVIENVTATMFGPAWSPAVAFSLLLAVLALRLRRHHTVSDIFCVIP